jgi:hypothetical protein
MKAHKIIEGLNKGMESFVGSFRVVVAGTGTTSSKFRFEADSLTSNRYLLYCSYGRENVYSAQEALTEAGETIKSLSPEQLQVKTLTYKSAQLKQQAKKTKSFQSLQKAQQNHAKVSSTAAKSSID